MGPRRGGKLAVGRGGRAPLGMLGRLGGVPGVDGAEEVSVVRDTSAAVTVGEGQVRRDAGQVGVDQTKPLKKTEWVRTCPCQRAWHPP